MLVTDDILKKGIFEFITRHLNEWLVSLGMEHSWAKGIADFSGFIITIILAIIAFYIVKAILV